ncbi:MAG TPA: hypothetical protein VF701_12770 [Thermoanaerobaculia bacterium]
MSLTHILIGLLIFVASSLGGLAIVGFIVVRLPADYFSETRERTFLNGRHPMLRMSALILKNLAGVLIVALGVVLIMPGIPGPGALTILIGIMLLDFPGKLRLERWMVSRPAVRKAINKLRVRHNRPPLVLDADQPHAVED